MPTDPYYVAPRAEPFQLAAGESAENVQFGFPIAALAINNNTEYYAFITPSNRPGFWVQPYQIGTLINLYPPANSISITQSLDGPNNTSGAISSGATATLDLQVYDAPLSPQAGFVSGPDPTYEFVTGHIDLVANWGSTSVLLTAAAGEDLIITKLSASLGSPDTGALALSRIDFAWQELPAPAAPAQPFFFSQSIHPVGNPYVTDSFVGKSAIIHENDTLSLGLGVDNISYYTNAGLTVKPYLNVQFYRVIA